MEVMRKFSKFKVLQFLFEPGHLLVHVVVAALARLLAVVCHAIPRLLQERPQVCDNQVQLPGHVDLHVQLELAE